MAYTVPQVLVFQEFNLVPAIITAPLGAFIGGPHAQLVRYAVAAEKALSALGAYDYTYDQVYSWPGLVPGGVIDDTYVKLFVEDAQLQYYQHAVGGGGLTVTLAPGTTDSVVISGANGFATNGSNLRLPALYDRDVQVGDTVQLRGIVSAVTYDLNTRVKAVNATQTASSLSGASPDTNNWGTQSSSSVVTKISAASTCNTLHATLTGYSALDDGFLTDTYTVTVIQSSLDGDLSTALLRITTASGVDDVLSIASGDLGVLFSIGKRGLVLNWTCAGAPDASTSTDDLVVGDQWTVVVNQAYTALAGTVGGTYTGTQDTTYIITVTRGGAFAAGNPANRPQITVSTAHGTDASGPVTVSATNFGYQVGTLGITFLINSGPTTARYGDKFYIGAFAAQDGKFNVLQLYNTIPAGMRAASDMELSLSIIRNIQVPEDQADDPPNTNWTPAPTELTVNSGLSATDPSLTNNGVPFSVGVVAGNLFVEYRAWQQSLVGVINGISNVGAIDTAVPGALSPDNPLKWALFNALTNSNGATVYYAAVADPTSTAAWTEVVALLVGVENVYGIVPLTRDNTVLDLFLAHVNEQSSPEAGMWRVLWKSLQATTQKALVSSATSTDGNVVLATLADDPNTTGTQYTLLHVPGLNANFVSNGTLSGDVVRYGFTSAWGAESYSAYPVATVVNEDTLLLATGGPVPVSVAQKVEVWHPLARAEIAADLAFQAGAYDNTRVRAVWPDVIGSGGTVMDGYNLCAALAALRSGIVPHQGMTNLQIAGFDDVSRSSTFFNADELNTMAGGGVWVVTQNAAGNVYTRHATTTNVVDVNHREEMVVSNVDSISFVMSGTLAPFIGVTNVTPSAIAILQVEIISAIEYLKANGFTPSLGSQLIDGTILQLRPHATLLDRVVAVVGLTIPYPLNNLEIHLVI